MVCPAVACFFHSGPFWLLCIKYSDLTWRDQAHNCILATSLNGADLGYDVSVISDAIGDRNIPGATAEQVVEVRIFVSRNGAG